MKQETSNFKFAELLDFFKSKIFLHTLLRIFLVLGILWILQSFFLNFYTNHGQQLILPKYQGVSLENTIKHAGTRGYEIVISDSLFVKGKPGGIVLSQIPVAGSKVKRGRAIYVTITKFQSETFQSDLIPVLYGKKYEFKKIELFNTFELNTKIRGVKFDAGPENHILEVYYKDIMLVNATERKANILINKGDTLEFVISTKAGGEVPIPDLLCQTLAAAKFLLSSSKLELGSVIEDGEITDRETAYIIDQSPKPDNDQTIILGTEFKITIIQQKPERCN
ncbi:MAG: PASTA domain-containing protein [Saprospiraceae bacterium]|nr:PASTA domain-containing protein [Saprospiraceae bacterium]MBK8451391.1 PASTA domain-containing protein [Saprospiraceae bacterium]MBK9220864.1 PASTA domain-containing protein [Saprospiraceae bacterium]MBK9722291.1 PASTA domain-containing protein [Saprospiraceae bacterium]